MMDNGQTTTEAMVVREEQRPATGLPFDPRNIDEAFRICKALVSSGFLPKAIRTPEAALAILMTGRELDIPPMQSFRAIHVIEGRPTMAADLMAALPLKHGVAEYFTCIESTDDVATYETKRRGAPQPVRRSFTLEQAKQAGLTGKDNWRKYPAAMLRARAKSDLARDVYPDVLVGIYDPDEVDHVRSAPVSPDIFPDSRRDDDPERNGPREITLDNVKPSAPRDQQPQAPATSQPVKQQQDDDGMGECRWCGESFTARGLTRHENKCQLNPENVEMEIIPPPTGDASDDDDLTYPGPDGTEVVSSILIVRGVTLNDVQRAMALAKLGGLTTDGDQVYGHAVTTTTIVDYDAVVAALDKHIVGGGK